MDIKKVRNAMRQELDNCVDPKTNEVNCTLLAENVASELDLYVDHVSWTIPEEVFDLAVEVADKYG